MERATIQDALDYCLENPEGLTVEELLARFPEYREELGSLLGLAATIITSTGPAVPAQRREAMKARLMQAASAQSGRAAQISPAVEDAPSIPVSPAPVHRPPSTVKVLPARRALPWFLRPGWVVAAAALLLVALTWWSSVGALPDSPFYGVRLASESVALSLAGSDADRTRVRLGLANNRLYDLRAMQERGKLAQAQPAFDSYSSNLDNSVKMWRGLPDQPHTELAQLLYVSSVAGEVTFRGFGSAIDSLPAALQQKIRDTQVALSSVNSEAAHSLDVANINPAVVLGKAGSDLAPLLTPVPSTVIAVPTYTPVAPEPVGGASPAVPASSSTPTLPNPSPTVTITSTTTATASATSPGATSTLTTVPARPDPTRIPPRRTATRTPRPAPPSHTRVPPPIPTATHQPVPSSATPTPPPPPEPTSPPREATVCDLRIGDVTATCPGGCVGWTATVHNKGDTPVDVGWTVELQIMQRGGGFDAVTSQSGTSSISPGDSIVRGKICYDFPPNTTKVRVEFYIDTDDNKCPVPSHKSRDMSPCK
jgi:hypothetical protein